jgi:protein-tyrosine phosphatase
MMIEVYRDFVDLPSAKQAYRQLFLDLADPSGTPALYHCTAGKDRTGWATAALLSLLGVPEDQVYADYLRSNETMLPAYAPLIERFVDGGGDPAVIKAILGVKADYLKAAFDEMRAKYGSIEGYFNDGLRMDEAARRRMRARFLTVK